MLFSSGGGLPPVGSGNIGVGGAGIVNSAVGQPNPSAVNPAVGQPNPPAWGNPNQLKAGNVNGPIQVNDPNNQNFVYNNNGTNQPLLGYIARALEHQSSLGLHSLSRFTFTSEQSLFILNFLFNNHIQVYNNIMHNPYVYRRPLWSRQSNTKNFRDLLINGR